MTFTPKLVQHLRAPNDVNGNPRRCYVIYSDDATILDVIDEGYVGRPMWVRDLAELPEMNITATEYKQWLKMGAEVRESV